MRLLTISSQTISHGRPGLVFSSLEPRISFRILSHSFKAARQNPEQKAWVWGYEFSSRTIISRTKHFKSTAPFSLQGVAACRMPIPPQPVSCSAVLVDKWGEGVGSLVPTPFWFFNRLGTRLGSGVRKKCTPAPNVFEKLPIFLCCDPSILLILLITAHSLAQMKYPCDHDMRVF